MNKEYQVLFYTHTGAIKFQRALKKENIPCELMPVPRALSSNCGVSARICYNGQVEQLTSDQIEKIYENNDGNYTLAYEAKI